MEKQVYRCECGYITHFEKALTAHCRFRHHHPAGGTVKTEIRIVGDEAILPEVEKEVKKAVRRTLKKDAEESAEKTVTKVTKKTTTRKPRTKKAETKE